MIRKPRGFIAGLTLILLASSVPARAQGWGWDGWGGWTSTPEASFAQGMGHYYAGRREFSRRERRSPTRSTPTR